MPDSVESFGEIQSNDDNIWVGRQKNGTVCKMYITAAAVEPDGWKTNWSVKVKAVSVRKG